MRKIYIRHADKQYKNMKSELFKHDPGITQIGVERSRKVALKLIEQYGEPVKIVSSPYRRARETAMIMNMTLKNPLEEIIIDTTISEYLGNHANTPLDVTNATKFHNPPHPETFDDMKKRVKKHVEKVKKEDKMLLQSHNVIEKGQLGVVWYITHGLIMKQIAGHSGIKNSSSFPCLTCLSVTETPEMVKTEFLIFRGDLKHEKKSEKKNIVSPDKSLVSAEKSLVSAEKSSVSIEKNKGSVEKNIIKQ